MPAIQTGKVLVSGANGYIAVWIVKKLLEQGFSVRGTVRSEKSFQHLQQLFGSYGDKLELVVVPDITKDGAFDEAVKGADAVAHTASPFHFNAEDPREIIDPAVQGTTGMLQSVLQHGENVKRVIILSSVAAIMELTPYPQPVVLTEKDWNVQAAINCETQGKNATRMDMYYASKTLAERAAWDFETKHKGEMKFDIVALNPPYVHGPFLHEVSSAEKLNTSLAGLFNAVIKGDKSNGELTQHVGSWVDVRNISEAHVLALQREAAGGKRIIIASGPFTWQHFVAAAHQIDDSLPAGVAGFDLSTVRHGIVYNTTRSRDILGISYIDVAQSTADMLKQFKENGWY